MNTKVLTESDYVDLQMKLLDLQKRCDVLESRIVALEMCLKAFGRMLVES